MTAAWAGVAATLSERLATRRKKKSFDMPSAYDEKLAGSVGWVR